MTFWTSEDNVAGKKGTALYVILPTIGCYRYRIGEACYMCSYPAEAPKTPWTQRDLIEYFKKALRKIEGEKGPISVRIFTSGSFFDDGEVKPATRKEIFSLLAKIEDVKEIVVETRSELVRFGTVKELVDLVEGKHFEVAVGLETASDDIADVGINKGNTFEEFITASRVIREAGAHVKTYLLLKPAFLNERDGIEDIKESIKKAAPYTDTFSINVTNIQRGTVYERLWEKKEYRPPWLWSVVEVIKWAKRNFPEKRILSDPVGAGSKRGPHNCGKCDKGVARAIRDFSNTQDMKHLKKIEHECIEEWEYIIMEGLLDWQLQMW